MLQMLAATDDNIVRNGGFSSISNWTQGTGWSIGSGKATSTGAGSLTQTLPSQKAGNYQIAFTVSGWAGTGTGLYVSLGSTDATPASANGTFTETVAVGSAFTSIGINPATGSESFSIDSITIRRV
jgi:hypothetical protein